MRRIFLVTAPPPRWKNIGDHAQLLGVMRWLSNFNHCFPIIVLDKDQNELSNKFRIGPSDIILCHPGGNLGERGMWSETGRRHFIRKYKDTAVVILPQTIYFSASTVGQYELCKSISIFSAHSNLSVYARDQRSAALAKLYFHRNKLLEPCPDFALLLDENICEQTNVPQQESILIVMRQDNESKYTLNDLSRALGPCKFTLSATVATFPITEGVRQWVVQTKIYELSRYSVVITDRLHGLIFSYLARRPCVVLPNSDHKLASTAAWFSGLPWIQTVLGPAEVPSAIARMRDFQGCHLTGVDFSQHFRRLSHEIFGL